MARKGRSPTFDFERADSVLRNALPPSARHRRFARTFSSANLQDLRGMNLTKFQIERLARILPAIAYYIAPGPNVADVRDTLFELSDSLSVSRDKLEKLLQAPETARCVCKTRKTLRSESE